MIGDMVVFGIRALIVVFIMMFLIPAIVGYGLRDLTFYRKKGNILSDIVMGTCVLWAIYIVLCIPMTLMGVELSTLNIVFAVIGLCLCLMSLVKNKTAIIVDWINDFKTNWANSSILTVLIVLILYLMVIAQVFLQSPNDDDYEFVTMSVSAVQTNSLMKYDPVTAMEVSSVLVKRMIAPFPMLIATYSSFAGLHPAVFAHTVFPVCIIPICFMTFVLLAQTLFKGEDARKRIEVFLIFILLIMAFGGYATRSLGSMLLLRSWQGKTMVLSFVLPLVWKYMLESMDSGLNRQMKTTIAITLLGGALSTAMVDIVMPVFVFGYAAAYAINEKSLKKGIELMLTAWPSLAFFAIYIVAEMLQRLHI